MGATHLRRLGVGHRVDHGRRGRDTCQSRHLRDAQLVERLAEVDLGGGTDSISALSQKDLVHIEREDLLLGELGFHEQGDVDLAHFPFHVASRRQKHVAGHLHGDRAGPLTNAAGLQVGDGGAQNPLPINAMVLKEAIILGG